MLKSLTGSEPHRGMAKAPMHLVLGAHPANLGGCLSLLDLMGNPTYLVKRSFTLRVKAFS
jgi:hypothetical protein